MKGGGLPSFQVGLEVRSHQGVPGSPAAGRTEDEINVTDILRYFVHMLAFGKLHVQILPVRRPLLSLPSHHLDPEGEKKQDYWYFIILINTLGSVLTRKKHSCSLDSNHVYLFKYEQEQMDFICRSVSLVSRKSSLDFEHIWIQTQEF